jgi:hypothetical protein
MRSVKGLIAVAGLGVAAGVSNAGVIATLTADNHYALYTGNSFEDITFIGRNELDAKGSDGGYNWSEAETWKFEPQAYIYVAVWSDDAVAQGWIGQFEFDEKTTLLSSDKRWEYVGTDLNLGDGDPAPSVKEIGSWVNLADNKGLWDAPFVAENNGMEPWGTIAGITKEARWTWGNPSGRENPMIGGDNFEEYQIFRIPTGVPTPGASAMAVLSGALLVKRRR